MVDESHDEGMLDESEYERLAGALGFTSRTVDAVLLPLDQLETVPRGARVTDVEAACGQTGYSRFPVVGRRRLPGRLPAHQGRPPGRPPRTRPGGRGQVDPAVRRGAPHRHPGQRAADAAGQGRPHGHAWSTSPATVAGRGHPRGRHRGAGRRDPRRSPRRGSLSADACGDGRKPGRETSAVVGGPPGRACTPRSPPRAILGVHQRYLNRAFYTFVVNRFFRTIVVRIERRPESHLRNGMHARVRSIRVRERVAPPRSRPRRTPPGRGRRRGTGTRRCAAA